MEQQRDLPAPPLSKVDEWPSLVDFEKSLRPTWNANAVWADVVERERHFAVATTAEQLRRPRSVLP